MLSQKYIKECFNYFAESGELYWKERPLKHFKTKAAQSRFNKLFSGNRAGTNNSKNGNGYFKISLCGRCWYSHRLIWVYVTGKQPIGEVDHIDHNRENNRFENLRLVSRSGNQKNATMRISNSTGICGVSYRNGSWVAQISVNGKVKHLKQSTDFFEVCCYRKSAEVKYDFHLNHGKKEVNNEQ